MDPIWRVKEWSGTGEVVAGARKSPCSFRVHQRGDGTIVVDCENDGPATMSADRAALHGTTDSGEPLVTWESWITRHTSTSGPEGQSWTMRTLPSHADVGDPKGAKVLRYGLVNLGDIHDNTRPEGEDGPCITLDLDGRRVRIFKRPDVESTLKELKLSHGIGITAEAVVEAGDLPLEATDEVVNRMCLLLTLAQGSGVHWIYRDAVDPSGRVVATHCLNAVSKPYGGSYVLVPNEHVVAFAEAAYPSWEQAERDWGVRNAILGYTDAKGHADYHELRAVKMAVVLEHIKGVYLERTHGEYTLPDDLFQQTLGTLQNGVRKLLKELFPDQQSNLLDRVVGALAGINRTSFPRAMRGAASEMDLALDKHELDRVTTVRNSLIHRMRFSTEVKMEDHEQYDLLNTFAGKLILAALHYHGTFYDWTTRPPRLVELKRATANDPPQ